MANPYVTGPAYAFVNNLAGINGGGVVFLGTGEQGVDIAKRRHFVPIINDIGGQVPFSVVNAGEEAFVSIMLTRWNEAVLAGCEAISEEAARGTDGEGDIGSDMIGEGNTVNLWIAFPYSPSYTGPGAAPKAAFAGLPAGYHFAKAYVVGPEEFSAGTRPLRSHVLFHCLRTYAPSTGELICYNHDMSALNAVSLN